MCPLGDYPCGRVREGHMADLGGIPQCPLLYRLSGPGGKGGIKILTSQKFPLLLECSDTWRSPMKGIYDACRP